MRATVASVRTSEVALEGLAARKIHIYKRGADVRLIGGMTHHNYEHSMLFPTNRIYNCRKDTQTLRHYEFSHAGLLGRV